MKPGARQPVGEVHRPIGNQYGFSSTVEGNALTYDQQAAKLALIVETAQEIWGD